MIFELSHIGFPSINIEIDKERPHNRIVVESMAWIILHFGGFNLTPRLSLNCPTATSPTFTAATLAAATFATALAASLSPALRLRIVFQVCQGLSPLFFFQTTVVILVEVRDQIALGSLTRSSRALSKC